MKVAALIAIVLAVGCTKKDNALPPEAWGVSDYVGAGLPAPDHPWTKQEYLRALQILVEVGEKHPDRLPRFESARSGPVFSRVLSPAAAPPDAPIGARFGVHAERYDLINRLSKRYVKNALAPPTREWIELMGLMLREGVAMQPMLEPFLASFAADDPKTEVRRGGLLKVRAGWGGMILGGLGIAADIRTSEADRIVMVQHITNVLPTLFDELSASRQDEIRELASKLVADLPAGPLRDAVAAAQRLTAKAR